MTFATDTLLSNTAQDWAEHSPRLLLKEPPRELSEPYAVVLGGSETYGKDVDVAFPQILEQKTHLPVINLGVLHAGVSLFNKERWMLDIASGAELTVLQIMGAQNMSNRLYHVHPCRNDRFLKCSSALQKLYPTVDFAEINFTGHLVTTLRQESEHHFKKVVEELQFAWVQRMRRVITSIGGKVHLLWISDKSPDAQDVEAEPMFVDRAMLEDLAPFVTGLTEVVRPRREITSDPSVHAQIAEALLDPVRGAHT